jgi:hypothetical protein
LSAGDFTGPFSTGWKQHRSDGQSRSGDYRSGHEMAAIQRLVIHVPDHSEALDSSPPSAS